MWYRSSSIVVDNEPFEIDLISPSFSSSLMERLAASAAESMALHQKLQNSYQKLGPDYSESLDNAEAMPYTNARRVLKNSPISVQDSRWLKMISDSDSYGDDDSGEMSPQEAEVGQTFYNWNHSPAGIGKSNIAYLMAAQKEFHDIMTNPQLQHIEDISSYWRKIKRLTDEHPEIEDVLRQVLRGEYQTTQEAFKKEKSKSKVRLYRGMNIDPENYDLLPSKIRAKSRDIDRANEPLYFDDIRHHLQPISSFTASPDIAGYNFGRSDNGGIGLVSYLDVPTSRILSSPFTGRGQLDEHEYNVLGGDDLRGGVMAIGQNANYSNDPRIL